MKLLLDEHLSPRVAGALRAKGYDLTCALECGLGGAADRVVWERAIAEGRVVVSYNTRDFLPLFSALFQDGVHHPGLVVVSPATIAHHDFGGQLRALECLLARGEDLADQVVFLAPNPQAR
jgi:hypothetical protein